MAIQYYSLLLYIISLNIIWSKQIFESNINSKILYYNIEDDPNNSEIL